MKAAGPTAKPPAVRLITQRQIATVHVAKAKCGMTDAEYRDLLGSVGVESSTQLNPGNLKVVLERFAAMGFAVKGKGRKASATSKGKLMGKILAQCAALKVSRRYADGVAARMFRVKRLEWCSADQLRRVVAALTYRQQKQEVT